MNEFEKEIFQEVFKSLERIDEGLDELNKKSAEQNTILAVQAEQLKEHIKRSDTLERYVGELEEQLKPIQKHVTTVNALILLLGGIFAVIAALEGILKIVKLLH